VAKEDCVRNAAGI